MKTQVPFYPGIKYINDPVMFEINEHDYGRKTVVHLINENNHHIPDFYLIDIEPSGILLERGVGRYLDGNMIIDLNEQEGRILKIIGVDAV